MHISLTQSHWPLPRLAALLPGVALAVVVAIAAVGLRQLGLLATLSPVLLAILLGLFTANIAGLPAGVGAGFELCSKTLLRLAVMLLGVQITFADILSLGPAGLVAVCTIVLVTLSATVLLGRLMRVSNGMTLLIAGGTAICGASAVAAVNGVVRSRDAHVSYAIAIVTVYGTVCMFLLPLLRPVLGLSETQFGFWAGLSLHEVAQAVAAGFSVSDMAGQTAVTAKLGRVMLLSAVTLALALIYAKGRRGPSDKAAAGVPLMPWFLIGFLCLAALNSAGLIPAILRDSLILVTPMLMTVAMAAIGLNTRVGALASVGWRPLVLGGAATAVVTATGLALVVLLVDP